MMRYKVSLGPGREVEVVLAAAGPDDFAPVQMNGHPADILMVEELLYMSHGVDGRLITKKTTPVDLTVAMKGKWLRAYDPICLEGEEIVRGYVHQDVR